MLEAGDYQMKPPLQVGFYPDRDSPLSLSLSLSLLLLLFVSYLLSVQNARGEATCLREYPNIRSNLLTSGFFSFLFML